MEAERWEQIENLYKRKLLRKQNVLTFADFTGNNEADIEDMFEPDFYLMLINGEYRKSLTAELTANDLRVQSPRILVKIAHHFEAHPLKEGTFNHYRPARYLVENMATLKDKIAAPTRERFESVFTLLNQLLGR